MDAIRPERLGGKGGGERRVDASGDADQDVAEAVLLHVVAEAELEREPHLVELVERRRHGAGRRARRGRRRAAPPRRPGALATTRPSASSTNEFPSKTSSSCPPTALQKTRAQPLSRARAANISSRSEILADVEGRCGEVDEHVARPPARSRRQAVPVAIGPRRPSGRASFRRLRAGRRRCRARSSASRRTRRSSAAAACDRRRSRRRRRTRGTRCRGGRPLHAARRRARRCP